MKRLLLFGIVLMLFSCSAPHKESQEIFSEKAFQLYLGNLEQNRVLSAALKRSFEHYQSPNS